MSYRILRPEQAGETLSGNLLFVRAQTYANFLWMNGLPARAILALCRAFYLDPRELDSHQRQPWEAFIWMLRHHNGIGFLGNPRVSFIRQAVRIHPELALKRHRAWALWYLTRATLPHMPPDPSIEENPPPLEDLIACLEHQGLPDEGGSFKSSYKACLASR